MLTLLIETSTERGLIAVLEQGSVLFQKTLPFGYQNSTYLLPTIEAELKQHRISLKQLSLIAVGIGPGSYTGLRVGVVVGKTLSYALKLPLVGVCSLEGFVPDSNGPFAAIIDAKIGGVYLLKGIKSDEGIVYASQPEICEGEQVQEKLKEIHTLVTPYSARIQPLLHTRFPDNKWTWQEVEPSAVLLGLSALKKFQQGQFSSDTHLDLLYLRKTQAEIEKNG